MNKKILVIEDDEIVRQNLVSILEASGFEVLSAELGNEGINIVNEQMPNLILCDVNLPDMLGYDILASIRLKENTKGIPFVFLTALSDMSDLRKGMNLGADDYLIKPFIISELLGVINRRLELHQVRNTDNSKTEKQLDYDSKVFLRAGEGILSVKINSIVCIIADAEYSYVHLDDMKKHIVRKLMKEWEEILPEKCFLRIHKSIIINLNAISKIEKWFNGAIKIDLKNYSEPLIASRRYSARIKELYFV